MNLNRKLTILVVLTACLAFGSTTFAQDKLSGTIEISSTTIAIGIGVSWGHGTLKFKGKEYRFKVDGLSILDLGIVSVSASGEVYNLEYVSDFAGTYSGGEAAAALAGGAGSASLKNQNGVKLKIKSKKQGVQLKLAPEGLKIKLVD